MTPENAVYYHAAYIAAGAIYGWWFAVLGVLVLYVGIFGWAGEPLAEHGS